MLSRKMKIIGLYPNPAQNELTLLWPSSKNYTSVQILDLNGRLVKSEYTSSSPQRISTSQLENGFTLFT